MLIEVILVNELDEPVGTMEKMEAHWKGLLHRAFSVFIFNGKGEMLIQQRAAGKYHNGGLWTNTCCSHPLPGEQVLPAAKRRLSQEMGFSTDLHPTFNFIYKATFNNGLTEHEYDHVLTGLYDGDINTDTDEVGDYCYKTIEEIESSLLTHPQKYTEWFKIALPGIKEYHAKKFGSLYSF
ncbi:MAG: isopentenyl-diphosphate Delta-isomerase [Bacteroidota bacterium]|nr:isopentenyl-diphosphate Delta-isomerase [Bacteroidota bacterium]